MLLLIFRNFLIKPIYSSSITISEELPFRSDSATTFNSVLFKSMKFTRFSEDIFVYTLEFSKISKINKVKLLHVNKVNDKNVYTKIPITPNCIKTHKDLMRIKIKLDFTAIKHRGVFVILIYPHWTKPLFFRTAYFKYYGTKQKIDTCEKQE